MDNKEMTDQPSSLLTATGREYVRGKEYDNAANERNLRSRMRKRIYAALEYDGHLLTEMNPSDRKQIFRDWESRQYDSIPNDRLPQTDEERIEGDKERYLLKDGIEGLLTFLKLGIDEGNVGDFDEMVANAVKAAENERGNAVKSVEVSISVEEYDETDKTIGEMTVDELTQRFQSGNLDLDAYIEEIAERRVAELEEEGSLSGRYGTESHEEFFKRINQRDPHEE